MKRQLLTIFILFISCYAFGGEIIVNKGESLHHALRQAREWRRTNDARCQGGITITLQEGRYYMQEPLFLRPEDSGTKESPLVIRGKRQSVICGDARQQHTQLWPKNGMMRMIDFNTTDKTITIAMPHDHQHVIAECCLAGEKELAMAVDAALAAKAAWEDLKVAMASGDDAKLTKGIDNLIASVTVMGENLIPILERSLEGIGKFVERIVPIISE